MNIIHILIYNLYIFGFIYAYFTSLISRMIFIVYSSISMSQLPPDISIENAGSYLFLL